MPFATATAKGILEANLTNTDATEMLHYLRQLGPCSKIFPEIKSCLRLVHRMLESPRCSTQNPETYSN